MNATNRFHPLRMVALLLALLLCSAPLSAQDFSYVFGTLRDFFTGETRGLEQFYEIVRHRDGR